MINKNWNTASHEAEVMSCAMAKVLMLIRPPVRLISNPVSSMLLDFSCFSFDISVVFRIPLDVHAAVLLCFLYSVLLFIFFYPSSYILINLLLYLFIYF